ncbi:Uncharacterized protein APZ42_028732 [Daphnia magna]|uniref:Uncharacterized protein n=1 Tax=Daphnia magna TaxID=35525 RepID=A0A164QA41_9CRUS|nr:Uncharacterized protein APZ42_028732 [Daphnia magna]
MKPCEYQFVAPLSDVSLPGAKCYCQVRYPPKRLRTAEKALSAVEAASAEDAVEEIMVDAEIGVEIPFDAEAVWEFHWLLRLSTKTPLLQRFLKPLRLKRGFIYLPLWHWLLIDEEFSLAKLTKKQKLNILTNTKRSAARRALHQTLGPNVHNHIPPRHHGAIEDPAAKELAANALPAPDAALA